MFITFNSDLKQYEEFIDSLYNKRNAVDNDDYYVSRQNELLKLLNKLKKFVTYHNKKIKWHYLMSIYSAHSITSILYFYGFHWREIGKISLE